MCASYRLISCETINNQSEHRETIFKVNDFQSENLRQNLKMDRAIRSVILFADEYNYTIRYPKDI